jgi:hypothetical protein
VNGTTFGICFSSVVVTQRYSRELNSASKCLSVFGIVTAHTAPAAA